MSTTTRVLSILEAPKRILGALRSEARPFPKADQGRASLVGTPAFKKQLKDAYDQGVTYFASIQTDDGCVVGEVVWCPMLTAQYVMAAFMTGQSIPDERQARFLKHFEVWQRGDGSWGMHAESEGYVYVTTLVYIALRLMGRGADDPVCVRARAWLEAHGGVLHIPSWGKLWLSMLGLYRWSAVPPVLPELWLQPDASPLHPRRMYCHTRMIYLGLGYLYAARFQVQPTPLLEALRSELYSQPFETIDFDAHRFDLALTDTFEAPHPVLKAVFRVLAVYDRHHIALVRRRAMATCLEHIVAHQRESRQAAISPVNGLLNALALFHAKHPDFEESFKGVDYWSWTDEAEGERFNGAHSHTWDTAFTIQAVCEGPRSEDGVASGFLENAARFLRDHQMQDEVVDRKRFYRDQRRGGFCFSDKHHQWPVSDCTAEAVNAMLELRGLVPAELLPNDEMTTEAGRFLLTRQNDDGGWGSYERSRGGALLKRFNPSEMFGNCMVEYSYVECTAACISSLSRLLEQRGALFSLAERRALRTAIRRGAEFLTRAQHSDGSWAGFWGVNYVYGTLFGITGLLAGGVPKDDPKIASACRWLLDAELPQGGWGESYRGCVEERYIAHEEPQVIMTAWALIALHRAQFQGAAADAAVERGLKLLLERQKPDGSWPKEGVGGVFFNTAMHHYMLYKDTFPVWALGLFGR